MFVRSMADLLACAYLATDGANTSFVLGSAMIHRSIE